MASGSISTRPQAESAPPQGRYEDFIQKRLEHTRRQVRLADVASSLMLLAIASLLFFLAVAVLDHWVLQHGLSFIARLALFALWVAGAGAFIWRFLLPPLANRINPVFAAQTIEEGRPTLKNSLINFLLLRAHPQDVAPVVFRAMEHRAAADLLKVPADHAMDRGRVVHLACVLAGVVAIFALYLALSPKNPFVSAARVLWPWSSIPAPTRVHIEEVTPGDKGVFNDDHEPIVATVTGLRDGEEVALLVSTADGQMVDERMPMTRVDDANHYRCELPPGKEGFQQDTSYRLTAGDATTQQYTLEFHVAPTITVDRIDYHFPPYTELPDRTIKSQGDIRALEGTQVTVYATANMAIKTARIDLNCAGLQVLPMMVAGTKAVGQFKLALCADNPGKPQYDQYSVLFTNIDGHDVRRPVRYHIDVDPDMPPEIKIVEPPQGEVQLPVDGKLRIHVRASDDYALRWVALHAQREARAGQEAQDLDLGTLLNLPMPGKARSKPFEDDYIFQPAEHKLKAGDRVLYWATADDNKEPRANHSDTRQIEKAEPPRIIQIVAPGQTGQHDQPGQPPPDGSRQPGENKQGQGGQRTKPENGQDSKADESPKGEKPSDDKPQDGQDGSKNRDKQDPRNGGKDQGQPSNDGGQGNKQPASDSNPQNAGDPNSNEAADQPKKTDIDTQKSDAVKDILKDKQEQDKKQQQNNPQQQGGDSKPDKGQQGGKPQDKQQDGNKSGDAQQPSGDQQGGNKQSPGNSGDKKDQGGESGNEQPQGDNKPGEGQKSDQNNSGQGNPQNPGGQGSNNQSTQNGNSGNKSDTGSQSQGNKDSGTPSSGDKPAQPNNGGQNKPSNSSAGSKESQNTGGQPNPDSKNPSSDKGQEKQSGGGSPKSETRKPSGDKGENGSPGGGNPPKAEKKQPGQGGGDEKQPAQGGSKSEEKKPAGGGDSSSQNLPSGKKPGEKPKDEAGNSDGGSQGAKPKQEEKPGGGGQSGGDKQPKPGEGEKEGSSGGDKKPGSKSSENKGGTADNQPGQKEPGKTGDPLDSHGAPDSQVDKQRSEQKTGDAHEGLNLDKSQSPGNSQHDSKSEGETRGDRKGGGGPGGGQADKKTGRGSPGSESAANNGGAASNERGGDATGNKAGEAVRSKDRTDSARKEQGKGGGEKREPADQQAADNTQNSQKNSAQNAAESQDKSGDGQAGAKSSQPAGKQASGPPAGGSPSTASNNSTAAAPPAQSGADPANLEFAKKQVDLALEHLKDQKDKGNSELLHRLGWTKEEAEKFLQNMQKLKESAQQPGTEGEAGKKAYNEFLKDLDLRPGGTQIRGGQTKTDDLRNVRDSGQMEPPSEWADQYHAYSQGTGQK